MKSLFQLALVAMTVVVLLWGFALTAVWLAYIYGDEPYYETGMALNAALPVPLRAWACDRLAEQIAPGDPLPQGCGRAV